MSKRKHGKGFLSFGLKKKPLKKHQVKLKAFFVKKVKAYFLVIITTEW